MGKGGACPDPPCHGATPAIYPSLAQSAPHLLVVLGLVNGPGGAEHLSKPPPHPASSVITSMSIIQDAREIDECEAAAAWCNAERLGVCGQPRVWCGRGRASALKP